MRRWSFWVVIAVMIVVNAATRWFGEPAALAAALLGTVLLLAIARVDDLTFGDLGLAGRANSLRGLRWAAVAVGAAALFYAALALFSPVNGVLQDDRAPTTLSGLGVRVLILIPLQTVLWEEVAFRGVLWAIVKRDHGWRVATAVSSILFGLWHVLPATSFAHSSGAVSDTLGSGAMATSFTVIGTVVFTALAGVLLCELRRRSDSLIAPIGAHWAINGLGVLASFLT